MKKREDPKYCSHCGEKLRWILDGTHYSVFTGHKLGTYELKCPNIKWWSFAVFHDHPQRGWGRYDSKIYKVMKIK